jgi:uncharacterized membrane protein
MNPNQPADPDAPIDVITGNLLRVGVLLSGLVLLIGGAVFLSRHATETVAEQTPDLKHFEPELEKRPAKYRRPADVFAAAGRGEARPLIQIGVMLLIATPLLRVVFTAGAFAWRRDWVYVLIPLVVLAVLVVGIWTGQVE